MFLGKAQQLVELLMPAFATATTGRVSGSGFRGRLGLFPVADLLGDCADGTCGCWLMGCPGSGFRI